MYWLNLLLRVLIGALFVFSGVVKLYPIEPFELILIDVGMSNWNFAPIMARILIGIELFLGVAVLFNTKHLKLMLKLTLLLTGFFTFYIILLLLFRGNNVNCGCFGDFILLTPLESIGKNAILIVLMVVAMFTQNEFERKFTWVYIVLLAIGIAVPFVVNPVSYHRANLKEVTYPYPFPVELIENEYQENLNINIEENEYILAFLSLSCSHCKTVAQKLAILEKKHKLPPIKVFFLGADKDVPGFYMESNAEFDYTLFNNPSMFKITDGKFPRIFLVKNGQVLKQWTGSELTYNELEEFKSNWDELDEEFD